MDKRMDELRALDLEAYEELKKEFVEKGLERIYSIEKTRSRRMYITVSEEEYKRAVFLKEYTGIPISRIASSAINEKYNDIQKEALLKEALEKTKLKLENKNKSNWDKDF